MVTVIIIGLVIAVWWLNESASISKSQLKTEKGKSYNFVELLYLLKISDSAYIEERSRFNRPLIVKRTPSGHKTFSVSASEGILYVTFTFKISYRTESKYFRFSIYDSPEHVSEKVISESKDFEEHFLNDNPVFRSLMLKPSSQR